MDQACATLGREQAHPLAFDAAQDLDDRLGRDVVYELDTHLTVGLSHRDELRLNVPRGQPGERHRVATPPGIQAVVRRAVV